MMPTMNASRAILTKRSTTTLFLNTPSSYRAFHASIAHRDLTSVISTTSDLLQSLHTATHLPWTLTLPLTAILVRVTIILPITLYTRRIQQRQLQLQPLLRAWTFRITAKIMREKRHLGPVAAMRNMNKDLTIKRREIYRRWNCQSVKNYLPLFQLPVFLLMIESIRSLSGASKGLLGLIWDRGGSKGDDTSDMSSTDPGIETTTSLGGADQIGIQTESVRSLSIDPTMATEGALWFPDLTVADPMLVLPFILSATMFLNIFSGPKRSIAPTLVQRRITRVLAMVALAAGPLCLHFPSGMLVYWIASTMSAYTQAMLLDRFLPLKTYPANRLKRVG